MHSSVSSTLVTVWAFKRNCLLIKVSMSTSVRSFRIPWSETRNYLDTGVPFKLPPGCNFNSSKRLNAHYTFRRRTDLSSQEIAEISSGTLQLWIGITIDYN